MNRKPLTLALLASVATVAMAGTPELGKGDVILTPPAEATSTIYSRNSVGLQMDMFSRFENFELYGWAQDVRFDGDDVYLQNPICPFLYDSWIKGKKTALGLEFPMPQPIYYFDEEGKEQLFMVDLFYYDPAEGVYERDTEQGRSYVLEDQGNGQYKFDYLGLINDNGIFYTYRTLSVCEDNGYWMGFSELSCRLIPFDNTMVTPPAGLQVETMQLNYVTNGYYVNVARDGQDLYVQGLLETNPTAWAKGTFNEAGTEVSFSSQYLGVADGLTIFMTGAKYGGQTGQQLVPVDSFTLTYDESENSYTGSMLWFCAGPELDEDYTLYEKLKITPRNPDPDPTPGMVTVQSWFNFDDVLEFGYVKFNLNGLNAEGDVLGWDNLSYALFIDGDIYTLDPADYSRLPEEMEWIPANFTDRWDILAFDRGLRSVYFYAEVQNSLAIQQRYLAEDGTLHYGEKAYAYGESDGVDAIGEDLRIVGEENYDLLGRRTEADAFGPKVRILRLSDGSLKATKVFRTK